MPRNDGDLSADPRAGGASSPGERCARSGAPVTRKYELLSPPDVGAVSISAPYIVMEHPPGSDLYAVVCEPLRVMIF